MFILNFNFMLILDHNLIVILIIKYEDKKTMLFKESNP